MLPPARPVSRPVKRASPPVAPGDDRPTKISKKGSSKGRRIAEPEAVAAPLESAEPEPPLEVTVLSSPSSLSALLNPTTASITSPRESHSFVSPSPPGPLMPGARPEPPQLVATPPPQHPDALSPFNFAFAANLPPIPSPLSAMPVDVGSSPSGTPAPSMLFDGLLAPSVEPLAEVERPAGVDLLVTVERAPQVEPVAEVEPASAAETVAAAAKPTEAVNLQRLALDDQRVVCSPPIDMLVQATPASPPATAPVGEDAVERNVDATCSTQASFRVPMGSNGANQPITHLDSHRTLTQTPLASTAAATDAAPPLPPLPIAVEVAQQLRKQATPQTNGTYPTTPAPPTPIPASPVRGPSSTGSSNRAGKQRERSSSAQSAESLVVKLKIPPRRSPAPVAAFDFGALPPLPLELSPPPAPPSYPPPPLDAPAHYAADLQFLTDFVNAEAGPSQWSSGSENLLGLSTTERPSASSLASGGQSLSVAQPLQVAKKKPRALQSAGAKPPADGLTVCANCSVGTSGLWRRDGDGRYLCNACVSRLFRL